ncbi:MAG: hypothetical protein HYZ57_07865 [Acidobacteria bacterium]|nr:hypothetical protein [Acidobacteriota bacterium]MBI3279739.1 hypothetical protein [Acidobacteriota bacterium]
MPGRRDSAESTEAQRLLSRMMVSSINAREVESARVSRVLHDEVGQVLSAVGLQLDVLKLDFRDRLPEIVKRTDEIQKMLDGVVQKVRALSYDLNPAVVERAGLQFALDRLVGRYREVFPGAIRFLYAASARVPLEVGNAWYKIAEHALANAVRHSQASRVELRVSSTAAEAVLDVRDDGTGFSLPEIRQRTSGLGLLLMEHYAALAGLALVIRSRPGKGTIVRTRYRAGWPGAGSATQPASGPESQEL